MAGRVMGHIKFWDMFVLLKPGGDFTGLYTYPSFKL